MARLHNTTTEGFIMEYNDYLTALVNLDYFTPEAYMGIDLDLNDYYLGREV